MTARLTQEMCLNKIRAVHGTRYGLDRVRYKASNLPIKLHCKEHGYFSIVASKVLFAKRGCPTCGNLSKFDTLESFLEKAASVHGTIYNYSGTYSSSKEKIAIECKKHGIFMQEPRIHLSGKGCPQCGIITRTEKIKGPRLEAKDWIEKILAGRYTLVSSCASYDSIVELECKKHGRFKIVAKRAYLIRCHGCKLEAKRMRRKTHLQQKLSRLSLRYAGNFSFYIKKNTIVYSCIHHHQEQNAYLEPFCRECSRIQGEKNHALSRRLKKENTAIMKGRKTIKAKKSSLGYWLEKARRKFDHFEYTVPRHIKSVRAPIEIKCLKHQLVFRLGMPWHVKNITGGCSGCRSEQLSKSNTQSTRHFIELSKQKHGNKYDYSKSVYTGKTKDIVVTCKKHGDFTVLAQNHMHYKTNYGGCPKCRPSLSNSSRLEVSVGKWVAKYTEVTLNNRELIKPYEIDIFCPEHNTGIEVNGMYWHSDKFKDKHYHTTKSKVAEDKGITLLQFWEEELHSKPRICKSMIKAHLGLSKRMYARKLEIRELLLEEKQEFFDMNHLQGHARAKIAFGLFEGDICMAAMSFGKPRFNNQYEWEIIRFANRLNTTVIGGASRLFAHFVKAHSPQSVLSYADRRISVGKMYEHLGFSRIGHTVPNYVWFKQSASIVSIYSRYKTQKHKLKAILEKFDRKKSEKENMEMNGAIRVYDAGNYVYAWKMGKEPE